MLELNPVQERYAKLFTAVIRIDKNLVIQYVSPLIGRYAPEIRRGDLFEEAFQLVRPRSLQKDNMALKLSMIFLMVTRASRYPIRGQMVEDGEAGFVLFGSPWLSRLTDDQIHQYELNDFPLHDAQLDWLFMLSAEKQQVKDLKRLSRDLEAAKAEAEAAIESKSAFFAVMSHEMRTPLNAIIGAIDLMSRNSLDKGQTDLLDISVSAAQQLLSVINDVLDYSKIEAGKLDIEVTEFELGDVLKDIIAIANPQAKKKNINLELEDAPALRQSVHGDVGKINQILINLITNAIKFTEIGSVTVSISEISRSESDVVVRFSVTDTGIGISNEDQERLFEQFWTSSISQGVQGRGSGLGLNIVQRIVALMGGDLGCESSRGAGSTFWVELPLQLPSENSAEESQPRMSVDLDVKMLEGKRVLVAEDNQANQVIARLSLEKLGIIVDIANNGLEVLEALQHQSYDAILMDIGMPDMNGLVAAKKIRTELGMLDLPIIACTAHSMSSDLKEIDTAHFNAYVGKPIDKKSLITALVNCIGRMGEPDQIVDAGSLDSGTTPAVGGELIDKLELNRLRNDIGDENMSAAIEALIAEIDSRARNLQEAFRQRELLSLGSEAHALKSSALSFGAIRLAELLKQVESLARSEDENVLSLMDATLLLAHDTRKAYQAL